MKPPALTMQWSISLCFLMGLVLLALAASDTMVDVARNGVANQSSDYVDPKTNIQMNASMAIDGKRSTDANYGFCSHTNHEYQPWWRVDLLEVYRVTIVNITNRMECSQRLNGAEIRIGNSLENNGSNNPRCANITDILGQTAAFECFEMEGRYVSINIPNRAEYLTLCEVEVYGSLAGNCSSTTSLPHEYHFVDKNMTWTEAQSYCRVNYTDLATIDNTQDMYRLMKSVNRGFTNAAWIGMKEGEQVGTRQWSDHGNCSFRNWNIGQPDNQGGNQTCVVTWMNVTGPWDDMKCRATGMNVTWRWDDRNCDEKRPFFCYHNKMILIPENKTWTDALTYCREKHDDLVSVPSEEVQRWVEVMAKTASTPHVWLGLRYTCTLNIWFWVSGEPICYNNWAPGNGTGMEDCGRTGVGRTGAVERDGPHHWISLPDTEQLNFICSISRRN